ncbi:ATP-binding protein [Candidatus Dojkabacteria bacterium]|jgi:predicted AAA+ superfamily ATPase|nr:ATP-binding protein [Candidatus Dojkabacteria bacterium]HRZ84706.1 ATP-binding protein [Candidatus Dojkabacteria bacterium]
MKNRELYLKRLLHFKDKSQIKVITGVRRSGKSFLLDLFERSLFESFNVSPDNIVKINFELEEFKNIADDVLLYKYIKEKIKNTDRKVYLLFDEIQNVKHWEKAINSLNIDSNVDIYITGSNAYLLSSELSTLLSGRYVEIKMLPLSYKEFLDFNDIQSSDENFEVFLKYGGMPAVAEYDMDELGINSLLEGIYSTAILKDVIERNSIKNEKLLRNLVLYLADNIGNIFSPNSIANFLSSNKEDLSLKENTANKTVNQYLSTLEKAFIFYPVSRYDVKGKEYLKTLQKYYIVDTGIRNMLLGYRDVDRGHILENVVYLELLRRGFNVSIGKVGEKEIDFVAIRPDKKVYYQVTESLLDKGVREREISALSTIKDNYEKVVLSMDNSFVTSQDGIKLQNVIDFLLE